MSRASRLVALLLLLSGVLGCAPSYVVANRPYRLAGQEIVSPVDWSVLQRFPVWVLTRDGPAFNLLVVADRLGPGRHLFSGARRSEREGGAVVRPGLGWLDLPELFADALAGEGFVGVEPTGTPEPVSWRGRRALRFELRLADEEGLAYRALGVAALDERQRLSYLLYLAPAEHFFERDRPAVEAILGGAGG
ncbi:MAG: hypothetical protein RML12_10505 [Xanthomonadales bacterium]|nr:hypothetical protein [Xanthomonadales bacterium]